MVECWFEGKLSYWAIISEARLVRVVPGSLTLPAARQPWTVRLLQDNSYHTGPLGPLTVTSHCPRLSRPTFPMTDGVSWSPLKSSLCPLVSPGVAEWLYRHLYMRLPPSPPQLGLGRRRVNTVNTVTAHSGDITVTCKWLHVYLQTIHHHLLQMTLILDC